MRELTRDSASEAFRFYAMVEAEILRLTADDGESRAAFLAVCGMTERYKVLLKMSILQPDGGGMRGGVSDPTPHQLLMIDQRLDAAANRLKDIEACERVFEWLDTRTDGQQVYDGLRAAYMAHPDTPLSHRLVRARITALAAQQARSAADMPTYRTEIYRRLRRARLRWAQERGLVLWEAAEVY